MGVCGSKVAAPAESNASLCMMPLGTLEARALQLGVLKSDVAATLQGPPSGIQKAKLVELILYKQKQRKGDAEKAFLLVDTDGSGCLDKAELAASFKRLGKHLSSAEMDNLMRVMDADGSGEVSLGEWLEFWAQPEAQRQRVLGGLCAPQLFSAQADIEPNPAANILKQTLILDGVPTSTSRPANSSPSAPSPPESISPANVLGSASSPPLAVLSPSPSDLRNGSSGRQQNPTLPIRDEPDLEHDEDSGPPTPTVFESTQRDLQLIA